MTARAWLQTLPQDYPVPVVDLEGNRLTPCTPAKALQNLEDGLAWLEDGVLRLGYRPLAYRHILRRVRRRDGWVCAWCGDPGSTVDHVIPVCWGGRTRLDNCVVACRACNHSRNNALPSEFIARTGFQPTHPVILRIVAEEKKYLEKAARSLRHRPLASCLSKEEAQIWLLAHRDPAAPLSPEPAKPVLSRWKARPTPFPEVYLP